MNTKLPNCICGGQPVVYYKMGIVIVMCSECKQFVTDRSEELAAEEWRERVYEQDLEKRD